MLNSFQDVDVDSGLDSELKISVGDLDMLLKIGLTKITLSFNGKDKQISRQSIQAQFFIDFFQSSSRFTSDIFEKISQNKDSRNKIKESVNITLKDFGLTLSGNKIISLNRPLNLQDLVRKKADDALTGKIFIEGMQIHYVKEEGIILIDQQEITFTSTQLDIFLYFVSKFNENDYSLEKQHTIGGFRVHVNKINNLLKDVGLKLTFDRENNSGNFPYIFTLI